MSKRPIWQLPPGAIEEYGLMSPEELEAHIEQLLAEQTEEGMAKKDWNNMLVEEGALVVYHQKDYLRIARVIGFEPDDMVLVEWIASKTSMPSKPGKVKLANLTVMYTDSKYPYGGRVDALSSDSYPPALS